MLEDERRAEEARGGKEEMLVLANDGSALQDVELLERGEDCEEHVIASAQLVPLSAMPTVGHVLGKLQLLAELSRHGTDPHEEQATR